MFTKSLLVLGAALLSSSPADFAPSFGRTLLALDDQDGDGITELLIVDQSHRDSAPTRFHVWSPGAGIGLRSFDHGTYMRGDPGSVALVEGIDGADAVYVGLGSEGVSLVLFSTLDGGELRRIRLECDWPSPSRAAIWSLGNVDRKPGDEVFVTHSASDSELEREGYYRRGIVVSLATGEVLRTTYGDQFDEVLDLDEDGVLDYVVRRGEGRRVCSGRCGEPLFDLRSKLDGSPAAGSLNPDVALPLHVRRPEAAPGGTLLH